MVARTPDVEDRRRVWISITATGIRRLAQERSDGLEWLEHAIDSRLTPDEQMTLASVLPILRKLTTEPSSGPVAE